MHGRSLSQPLLPYLDPNHPPSCLPPPCRLPRALTRATSFPYRRFFFFGVRTLRASGRYGAVSRPDLQRRFPDLGPVVLKEVLANIAELDTVGRR